MLEFEELAYASTPMGEISLRRRSEPRVGGTIVYEVKLGDEFLMSSLFTVGEEALATLGLAETVSANPDVVVGGLGLGYTVAAALGWARLEKSSEALGSLVVVEALGAVIEWHRLGLVPLGQNLVGDPRCRMVCGDFFALAANPEDGFDYEDPGRRFDAILLDIDHSPQAVLSEAHRKFYSPQGLKALNEHLKPQGVFAMWSNDPPDSEFTEMLQGAFKQVRAKVVSFANPYSGGESTCTVYVASNA